MVTSNSRKSAAQTAAQTVAAATQIDAGEALAALEEGQGSTPVAPVAPTTSSPATEQRQQRQQRFADEGAQKAYYQRLDEGLNHLLQELASEFGQAEPAVIDDLTDRLIERVFLIKGKIIRAVAAGKAGTGEQMSDQYRNAFRSLMERLCGALFPGVDVDTLLKMRGLPGINGSRFSRAMIQRLTNRAVEEYGGTEVAALGYDLLEQARDARQQPQ